MKQAIGRIGCGIGRIGCGIGRSLGACQITPPSLEYNGDLNIYELSSLLIDKFPDVPLYLPDMTYKLCSVDDVKAFLQWDMTSREKYQAEWFDCDDFAWRLKGNITLGQWAAIPFFVVWTDKHALNGFIDDGLNWWYVEPQTDTVQSELEDWQGTEIRFIAG